MKRIIAVIGTGDPEPVTMAMARTVGRLLAQANCVVVTGGLSGVMDAACEGAKAAGGLTVGILPTADVGDANVHVDAAIATGMGDARNAIIANTADGFVAVGGQLGTLSEIAFASKRGKPVVSLGSWDVVSDVEQKDTPEQAVEWVLAKTK